MTYLKVKKFIHLHAQQLTDTMDQISTNNATFPYTSIQTISNVFQNVFRRDALFKNMKVRDGMSFALMFDPTSSSVAST